MINLDNLTEIQKKMVQGSLRRDEEIRNKKRSISDKVGTYKEIHLITDDIAIVELDNPFDFGGNSFFEAYVNEKKVIVTGTNSLDSAIVVALAHKYGDPNSYQYALKVMNMELK